MFARFLADVRFALRLLRRNPGFSATVLGVLTLGLGATTAMFSLVTSLFYTPLPYTRPEELVAVWENRPWDGPVSLPDFEDWQAGATTMAHLAATARESFNLSGDGQSPESVSGAHVTGEFFQMMEVAPLQGRFLEPRDDRPGAPRTAVISASLWHRRFASDPGVVGRAVTINGEPFTILGVAPEGFRFGSPYGGKNEIWTPLAATFTGYEESKRERGSHFLAVFGRLRPGATLEAAQAQLGGIAAGLTAAHPETNTNVGARVVDLRENFVGGSRESVWMLFGAVGLVFLVVCANVASLLLARAASRRAELALRSALGAEPRTLLKQIVVETMAIFVVGAAGALALSFWLVRVFDDSIVGPTRAYWIPVRVDVRAFVFALVVALVAGLLSGLFPAIVASRVEPQAALAAGAARASSGRSQNMLRGALVVAQVAIAFALLFGVGTSFHSFANTVAAPVGFDPKDLVATQIALPSEKYGEDTDKIASFFESVAAKVAAEPGVDAVSITRSVPVDPAYSNGGFSIEGRPPFPPGSDVRLEHNVVAPGYFKMIGIPVLRGREFTDADVKNARRVMILSKAAADHYFPNEDPIGHRIEWGHADGDEARWCEIVGVVGDVPQKARGVLLDDAFVPLRQAMYPALELHVLARTKRGAAVLAAMPQLVASVDPTQAVARRQVVDQMVADVVSEQRSAIVLLGAFAAAALLLATMGLFGLVSYTTGQRTRELGIRLALGSSPEGILAIVMRQGLFLLGIGLTLGGTGSIWLGRALASRIVGTVPFDPAVFGGIVAVLGVAGVLAALLPAIRAVRIPPSVALRYE